MKTPAEKPPRYLTLTISPEENLLERTTLIEKILALFQAEDCRWIVIHGESGLGKTTLANACFHAADKRNLYGQFGWIPFTTNLSKSIVKAVSNWEPQGKEPKNEAFYAQAAREEVLQLRNYETSQLIVLDGVESEEAILEHLDLLEIRSAKILLTTRQPFRDPRFLNFRIPLLEDGDVLHFFSKAGLQVDLLSPEELKAVRGNPWLLQLLTAHIPRSSEKAAKDFVRQVFASLKSASPDESLIQSLGQSIFDITPPSAAACWLLMQFAALPASNYDLEALVAYLTEPAGENPPNETEKGEELEEKEAEKGADDLDIKDLEGYNRFVRDWPHSVDDETTQLSVLAARLVECGWLTELDGEFAIHDNTIQILKNRRLNDAAYFPELRNCFSINYFTAQHKRLKDNLQYENHLLNWLSFIEAEGSDEYLDTLNKLITFYEDTVDYELELSFRLRYFRLAETSQNEDMIINLKIDLAHNYRRLGQHGPARQYAETALQSAVRLFGDIHSLVGKCQGGLGSILKDLGEYISARDLLEAALASAVKNFGPEHPTVAVHQSNLATVYNFLGQYERARDMAEAALASAVKNFGSRHPNIAVIQSNLANVYQNLGQYEQARDLLETALASEVQNFGLEHPTVAMIQSNLTNVYHSSGQYERARDMSEAALASDLQNFGVGHPTVVGSQSNLANVYSSLGQYKRARDLFEAALASNLQNFGPQHPTVAILQFSLGVVFLKTSEIEKAKELFGQAYQIFRKQLGEQHPNTENVKGWLDSVAED